MGQLADALLIPYREQIEQLQEEVTQLKVQHEDDLKNIEVLRKTIFSLQEKISGLDFNSKDSELYMVIQDSVLNAVKHIKLEEAQEDKIRTIAQETILDYEQYLRQLTFRILVDNFPNMNFRDRSSGDYYNSSNIVW